MRAFVSAIRHTIQILGKHRLLWLPFFVAAALEAVFVLMVWLAPHPPFSQVLAPPIRFYFNDSVLHYPTHMWFMYLSLKHTHLAASVLLGAFMTGVACVMVEQIHTGKRLSFRDALVSGRGPYARIVLLWVISWGIAKGTFVLLADMLPKAWWVLWTGVGITVILQTLLVYAIPAAIFNGSRWWRALPQGILEAIKYPLSSLILVIIWTAPVIAIALLVPPSAVAQWMVQSNTPEIALVFVAIRFPVWVVCDTFLTVSIAHLWWAHRASAQSTSIGGLNAAL